jgi:hypothetical protein
MSSRSTPGLTRNCVHDGIETAAELGPLGSANKQFVCLHLEPHSRAFVFSLTCACADLTIMAGLEEGWSDLYRRTERIHLGPFFSVAGLLEGITCRLSGCIFLVPSRVLAVVNSFRCHANKKLQVVACRARESLALLQRPIGTTSA